MSTFLQLQDRALEECGYAFSGASTPRTRMKARVNDVYRRILRMPGVFPLLRTATTYTFASVANQTTYGMPLTLGRIDALTERTNMQRLLYRTLSWLRTQDPALSQVGTPEVYVLKGTAPVQKQPSVAAVILVKSTSASDTGTLRMAYLNAAGQRLTASVTITGTASAIVVSTATVVEILELSSSTAAVGVITLYETTATVGQELAVIPIGATSVKHQQVQLWPTPASAVTYYVDYTREVSDLVNDVDDPLLPPDFHDLLWRGAVMDEWIFKDDGRAEYMRQLYEADIRDLKHWVWNQTDLMPGPGDQRLRPSQLGGFYPAGT